MQENQKNVVVADDMQQAADKKRLNLLKILWPASELGGGFNKAYFSTYASYLYTDVYMLGTVFSGILTMIQTAIRWLGGPVFGTFLDRFSFKKSKYYPWIIGGSIFVYTAWILLFALPVLGISGPHMRPVAMALSVLIALVSPIATTPISAVYPQLSKMPKDRQFFAMFQKIGRDGGKTVFGYLCPAMLVFFTARMGESNAYAITGLIIGLITIAFYVALGLGLRGSYVERNAVERSRSADGSRKKNVPLSKMFATIFTNKALLSMFLFMAIHKSYYFIYITGAAYLFKYYFNDFAMMGTFMVVFNLTAIIGVSFGPLWRRIFKETKRCFVLCMATHVAMMLIIAVTFKSLSSVFFLCLIAVSSFFMGLLENYIMPMFAASSDYGAWKSGSRLDGITMSIYALTITTGTLVATAIRTGVLARIGLDAVVAGAAVSEAFLNGLAVLFGWIPFVMGCVSLLFVVIFPLNDIRIAQMNADIADGKTAATSAYKF